MSPKLRFTPPTVPCPHCGEPLRSFEDMAGVLCPACGREFGTPAAEPEPSAARGEPKAPPKKASSGPALKCPACDHTLTEMTIGSITADVCQDGCGGVWLDNQELTRSVSVDDDIEADTACIQWSEDVVVDADRKVSYMSI